MTVVRLNLANLDRELARRGLSARRLAAAAGVNEAMLSRARHGQPLRSGTFRRLAEALVDFPVLAGADLLLGVPPPARAGAGDKEEAK